jgi:hypothetical protein
MRSPSGCCKAEARVSACIAGAGGGCGTPVRRRRRRWLLAKQATSCCERLHRLATRDMARAHAPSSRLRLRAPPSDGFSSSRVLTRDSSPAGSRKRSASSRARCAAISTVAASYAAAAAPPRAAPRPLVAVAMCGTDCGEGVCQRADAKARGRNSRRTCSSYGRAMQPEGTRSWRCEAGASYTRHALRAQRMTAPRSGCPPVPQTLLRAPAAPLRLAGPPSSASEGWAVIHQNPSRAACGCAPPRAATAATTAGARARASLHRAA